MKDSAESKNNNNSALSEIMAEDSMTTVVTNQIYDSLSMVMSISWYLAMISVGKVSLIFTDFLQHWVTYFQ
jgi:hypothetical protein